MFEVADSVALVHNGKDIVQVAAQETAVIRGGIIEEQKASRYACWIISWRPQIR